MSHVQKLMKETGADKTTAEYLLEACSDDYQMAVIMFADSQPSASQPQTTSPPVVEEEEVVVRAPIPPKFEVLCPEPSVPLLLHHRATSTWASAATQNTAHLRDFEHETRLQEEMMGLGGGIFGTGLSSTAHGARDGAGPSARGLGKGSKLMKNKPEYRTKLKKLEDLFKPPLDIIYKGSFFMAREEGKAEGKWLLANIQDNEDFACHTLNRDVWSNANVRKLLADTFLLWQAGHDSEHGRKYMSFYPSVTFPYIAVIDSWTGEHMSTFRETDPKTFCLFLKDFISTHGKLASSAQQSVNSSGARKAPEPSSSKRKCHSSSQLNGHEKPTKVKRTESHEDVSSSSHSADGRQTTGCLRPVAGRALLDITEEDQMKLAIAESLKTCQSNFSDGEDDDDLIALDVSSDEETEINYSFEDQHESNKEDKRKTNATPDAASEAQDENVERNGCSSKGRPMSEWRASKEQLINGSTQAADTSCNSSHTTPESDDQEWRRLVADYDNSDNATIALRLPDGKRETVTLPRAAPLNVLRLFLHSKGYSRPGYRAFTGWPKKDLLELQQTMSLKNAGLLPRDTVILQQE
ncbi:UBX domain [Trinorchestia longiramus]|nr:UBX domain [Trinorchestia longiramus]